MKRKKMCASILTAAIIISSFSIRAFAAKDAKKTATPEFTAFLMYADNGGNWQLFYPESSKKGNCKVNGDGTYTVSANISDTKYKREANKASVFCVDILELAKELEKNKVSCNNYERIGEKKEFKKLEDTSNVEVKVGNIQIKVDGHEIKNVMEDRIYYGNIEEGGTFRIELANDYGETKEGKGAVRVDEIAPKDKIEVTFTLAGTKMGTPATIAPKSTPRYPGSVPVKVGDNALSLQTISNSEEEGRSSKKGRTIGMIIVAVVVIAGAIIVVKKKRKDE